MSFPDASNPIVFFKAMSRVFSLSLAAGRKSRNLIEELSRQAYESFASGVACEAQQDAAVACELLHHPCRRNSTRNSESRA